MSELTPLQIAYTEGVCREAFEDLGYQRSNETSGLFDSLGPILRLAASLAYDLRSGRKNRA